MVRSVFLPPTQAIFRRAAKSLPPNPVGRHDPHLAIRRAAPLPAQKLFGHHRVSSNERFCSRKGIPMSRLGFVFRSIVCAILLSAIVALAKPPVTPLSSPVPPAVRAAQKLFVSNAGADSGLFPHPFSGDPNRPYDQFYAALKATGQFQLVDDPSDADLVLELQLAAPNGPSEGSKAKGASDPLPMFRLVVYDRKTHYVLWALTESVEGAVGQKAHERNFDSALKALLEDFELLTGKAPAANH